MSGARRRVAPLFLVLLSVLLIMLAGTAASEPKLKVDTEWQHVPGQKWDGARARFTTPDDEGGHSPASPWDTLLGLAALGLLVLGLAIPRRGAGQGAHRGMVAGPGARTTEWFPDLHSGMSPVVLPWLIGRPSGSEDTDSAGDTGPDLDGDVKAPPRESDKGLNGDTPGIELMKDKMGKDLPSSGVFQLSPLNDLRPDRDHLRELEQTAGQNDLRGLENLWDKELSQAKPVRSFRELKSIIKALARGQTFTLRRRSGAAGDRLARIVDKWRQHLEGGSLLAEEEVRQVLGPNVSEETVARFMRFQGYAIQVMGNNLDKGRIKSLLEKHGGLGSVLREWIAEIGPERTATLMDRYADRPHVLAAITDTASILNQYTGRRQTLGAITEHRLAMKLAETRDLQWMKVIPHTNQRGADIYFVEKIVVHGKERFRAGIADAKGSFSGTNIQGSSAFAPNRIRWTVDQLQIELDTAYLKGQITPEEYALFRRVANDPDIIIGVGGTASVSDNARAEIRRTLLEKEIWSTVEIIPLD